MLFLYLSLDIEYQEHDLNKDIKKRNAKDYNEFILID